MTGLDQVFGSETVCDHLTWNHVISLLQFCMLHITCSPISGTYHTETSGSPDRRKTGQRRSRSSDMYMWERHTCSHIHKETNKPDCMCETHIHTHSSDYSRKAESSGLVVCVTVAPHPGQRYSRRIRSLNFTRHSSRHCRYAIFSTAHTPDTHSCSDKCRLNHILSVWHIWT